MFVQHFSPSSPTTPIPNYFFSPAPFSPPLIKNKKTLIRAPLLNSESTGFQLQADQNIRIGYNNEIKTNLSPDSNRLTSVMDIQRQRFSILNARFRQQRQRTNTVQYQPIQQSVIYPVILPSSRPQPRQQARSKHHHETRLPPTQSTQRATTAHAKHQQPLSGSNQQLMTLTNLTKILHILQTQTKMSDTETSTDMSTSTTYSARQRLQQHLQETAPRWWKPTRSLDNQLSVLVPSSINLNETSATPTQVRSSDLVQQREESDRLPIIV